MPRVLFLMPTQTYRASAFLNAAFKLKLDAIVATEKQQALEAFTPQTTLTLDFHHPERATEKIVHLAREKPLDAILPVDEKTVVIATLAAQKLGLKHNSAEAALIARDKSRLRRILSEAELPSPSFRVVPITDSPDMIAKALTYPCVVKPLYLSRSRGVVRVNTREEFTSAFEDIKTIVAEADEPSDEILIEEYIPGEEVALEGIFTEGELKVLAIFDKPDPLEGPYFEETIYVTPSRHPQNVQTEIAETVQRSAAAMGLRHGPVHAELRINETGIWVVEIAARSIGGLCSHALRFDDDMSLEELILRHAIGEDIAEVEREKPASGVMMIPIYESGVLQEVRGVQQAQAVPHIEDLRITIPISQKVEPLPKGDRYLGFIFARAERPEQVEQALREAHRKLEFEIR